jgi:hypothetical protein
VLIAGAGHARKDRTVPLYVARRAPERRVLAVAFVDVSKRTNEDRRPRTRVRALHRTGRMSQRCRSIASESGRRFARRAPFFAACNLTACTSPDRSRCSMQN